MAMIQEEDKLASAKRQGQAQFDSIREMVEALGGWQSAAEAEGWSISHDGKRFVDRHGNYCDDPTEASPEDACGWENLCRAEGIEPDQDAARQAIEEDALSVEVRSDWIDPAKFLGYHETGKRAERARPAEYRILLCTGGPACQIVGELSEHGEPETARMQVQDWFQPWTDMRPQVGPDDYDAEPIMLAYARCFWFGD